MSVDPTQFFELWQIAPGLVSSLGITFELGPQEVTCRMTITAELCGSPTAAHGGAVLSLLDTALGSKALLLAMERGCMCSTVEMKTNFTKPARVGATLRTETELMSAGRSLAVVWAKAYDEDSGELVACATGTFNLYGRKALSSPSI